MGKLLDLLKSSIGEASLSSRLGAWRQAVSEALDSGAASGKTEVWNAAAGVQVNDAVYVSGPNTVDRADASQASTSPAIGFVVSKPTATTAIVQYFGILPNTFVGLTAGTVYYLGLLPGTITANKPILAGQVIQQVAVAMSGTQIVVFIGSSSIVGG